MPSSDPPPPPTAPIAQAQTHADGGLNAIRGFEVQAIAAILDARKEGWRQLEVEPEQASEKVDLLWTLADGTARACQVKSSINVVQRADLETWGRDLSTKFVAQTYEVCVAAHPGTQMVGVPEAGGARVRWVPADMEQLRDLAAFSVQRFAQAYDVYVSPGVAARAVEALAGALLFGASKKTIWTPELLAEEVFRIVNGLHARSKEPRSAFAVTLLRVARVLSSSNVEETLFFYIRNRSDELVPAPALCGRITDSDNHTLEPSTSLGEVGWKAGPIAGTYTVFLSPPGAGLPPGGWYVAGVPVVRRGFAASNNGLWRYSDSIPPPDDIMVCDQVVAVVVFPGRERVRLHAQGASHVGQRLALWSNRGDVDRTLRMHVEETLAPTQEPESALERELLGAILALATDVSPDPMNSSTGPWEEARLALSLDVLRKVSELVT